LTSKIYGIRCGTDVLSYRCPCYRGPACEKARSPILVRKRGNATHTHSRWKVLNVIEKGSWTVRIWAFISDYYFFIVYSILHTHILLCLTKFHDVVKMNRCLVWLGRVGNMETDGHFVLEDGLQEMSGTNGFKSWLSLPHFLYASTTIQRTFNVNPSESLHLPFVSAH